MKTLDEIRDEIEYLIDTNFSDTIVNRSLFDDGYDPINYWYDVKNAGEWDDEKYDLDQFQDDLYKSYNTWMTDYLTDKYLAICPEYLEDKFGDMDDYFEIELSDILEQDAYVKWWDDVQDDFDANDYLIKE